MLLCQAALNDGKINFEKAAEFLKITDQQWQTTKQAFIKLKLLDTSGKITNWGKMQFKSDYSFLRVKKHRLKNYSHF